MRKNRIDKKEQNRIEQIRKNKIEQIRKNKTAENRRLQREVRIKPWKSVIKYVLHFLKREKHLLHTFLHFQFLETHR